MRSWFRTCATKASSISLWTFATGAVCNYADWRAGTGGARDRQQLVMGP